MRIAVLSDIHANLEALDAVFAAADRVGVDETWVLGDIVGYGADPTAVVERLRERDARLLAGNHDLAATDRFDTRWFNTVAAEAIRWTAKAMSSDTLATLGELEPRAGGDDSPLLVHGSVVDPIAEYVTNEATAVASFEADGFELCFFGHTHLPALFVRRGGGSVQGFRLAEEQVVQMEQAARHMVNPGSVGQPRDRDPRASWLLYEAETRAVTVHRVAYDVARAQEKIRSAGLPEVLAERLAAGR